MPAKSKSQQRFMGMVRAVQKGEMEAPSEAIARAAKSMKKKDVKDFAKTKHEGLPKKARIRKMDKIAYYAGYMEKNAYMGYQGRALDYLAPIIPFGNTVTGALKGTDTSSALKGAAGGFLGSAAGGTLGALGGAGLGGAAGAGLGYGMGKLLGARDSAGMGLAGGLAGLTLGGLGGAYLGASEGGHRMSKWMAGDPKARAKAKQIAMNQAQAKQKQALNQTRKA